MAHSDMMSYGARPTGTKVSHMRIGSATNERSTIGTLLEGVPTGDTATIFWSRHWKTDLSLVAVLNSFAFDYVMRVRLGGLHLDYHVFEHNPLPKLETVLAQTRLAHIAARLNVASSQWSPLWLRATREYGLASLPWKRWWAVTANERLRLRCVLDALVADLVGLEFSDMMWMFAKCDSQKQFLHDKAFYRTLDPKGFWRIDKEKDPELRPTILTLAAFRDLKESIRECGGDRNRGIEAFCTQNNGEGWLVPETLCIADLGLGHDDRAKKPQAVRSRLGDRFFPWQLEQSVEDSWKECELHARNILGAKGYSHLQSELRRKVEYATKAEDLLRVAESQNVDISSKTGAQRRLFPGEKTLFSKGMEDPSGTRRRK